MDTHARPLMKQLGNIDWHQNVLPTGFNVHMSSSSNWYYSIIIFKEKATYSVKKSRTHATCRKLANTHKESRKIKKKKKKKKKEKHLFHRNVPDGLTNNENV